MNYPILLAVRISNSGLGLSDGKFLTVFKAIEIESPGYILATKAPVTFTMSDSLEKMTSHLGMVPTEEQDDRFRSIELAEIA